jgi:hypothetical protein
MKLSRDVIAGLVCLAITLVLFADTFGLPQLPIVPVGPGFFPRIVLVLTGAACLVLVYQGLTAPAVAPAGEAERRPNRNNGLVAASFAIIAAYIALLPYLGFRIGTALFVAGFQWALERPSTPRQWAVLAALAVLSSAITYLVFDQYLMVLLPRGLWTEW